VAQSTTRGFVVALRTLQAALRPSIPAFPPSLAFLHFPVVWLLPTTENAFCQGQNTKIQVMGGKGRGKVENFCCSSLQNFSLLVQCKSPKAEVSRAGEKALLFETHVAKSSLFLYTVLWRACQTLP